MVYEDGFDLAKEMSYPTPFQNSPLLPLLLMSLAVQKHTPDTKRFFNREYDYIVVGAGTAGSVVAARLSEDPSKTVLLLEAGKSPPLLTEVPATTVFFQDTDINWNYFTEPQKFAAFAHENRRVACPAGKAVGGSSITSHMFYIRGNRADYNTWEEQGAHGWGWCGVYDYFLKSEDNADPDIAKNGYHAVGGPLRIRRFPYSTPLHKAMMNTIFSLGYPYGDHNGAQQSGFADIQAIIRKGQRLSTAKAYLVPSENRPNLDIVAEAYVTKVLFANRTAWGVQFDFRGHTYEVRAKSEVILSAGAMKTPQILMLSGIGPRRILEKFGKEDDDKPTKLSMVRKQLTFMNKIADDDVEIDVRTTPGSTKKKEWRTYLRIRKMDQRKATHLIPVIADLPVGKNYQDHGATVLNFYSTIDRPTYIERMRDPKNIQKYIKYKVGPLASFMGVFGVSFLANNITAQRCDLPEYEMYLYEGAWGDTARYGLSQEVYDRLYGPYLDKPIASCTAHVLGQLSRGYLSIRSRNPYDPPVIDPQYYKVRQDVLRVVQGMKTCLEIMEHPFMRELGFKPFETLMPGCEGLSDHDEYLECYARSFVIPVYHQSGSVRMGDTCDPNTVVDSRLRVKGIKKLRVVDASVMPKLVCNTESPVIMIAEKASDIIKGCS